MHGCLTKVRPAEVVQDILGGEVLVTRLVRAALPCKQYSLSIATFPKHFCHMFVLCRYDIHSLLGDSDNLYLD